MSVQTGARIPGPDFAIILQFLSPQTKLFRSQLRPGRIVHKRLQCLLVIPRGLPMLIPAAVATLFVPICKPIIPDPALSWLSENLRTFRVDSLGPKSGPSNFSWAFRPNECMQFITAIMFLSSNKSTVWNRSAFATPYSSQAVRKLPIFSILKNGIFWWLTRLTLPGCRVFINSQSIIPSLRICWTACAPLTSSNRPGLSRTASIHSKADLSS